MAVKIITDDPKGLLAAIRKAIKDGKIDTWEVDDDGDFVHSPEQWRFKAWLRPSAQKDALVFNTIGPKETKISVTTYAVYHGRFIEMLLAHFDEKFLDATASALPTPQDALGGRSRSRNTAAE
jgi:hypothetical protein